MLSFPLYLKSAVDRLIVDLGTEMGLPVVDMDSAGLMAELLDSDQAALVWAIGSLQEAPMDPLWLVDWDVGVKTSLDPAQYKSLDVVSRLAESFKVGTRIEIRDYTGDVVGDTVHGWLHIISAAAAPSQADRLAGVRLMNVQARAQRIL